MIELLRFGLVALLGIVCGADLLSTLIGLRLGLVERNPAMRRLNSWQLILVTWAVVTVVTAAVARRWIPSPGLLLVLTAVGVRARVVLRNWRLIVGSLP